MVRPWGEVTVDGRKVGLTPPLKVLQLPPGQHVIAIRNAIGQPYNIFADLNGDGVVDTTDMTIARNRLGTHL